jgi:hypothetical protein
VFGGDNEDGDEGGLSFGGVRIGWSLSESNRHSQHRTTTSGFTEIHGENAPETGKSRAVVEMDLLVMSAMETNSADRDPSISEVAQKFARIDKRTTNIFLQVACLLRDEPQ